MKKILSDLQEDYNNALPAKQNNDKKIARWMDRYIGKPYGNEVKGKSAIISKDIKRQVEWQLPSLLDPFVSSHNIITTNPVTYEDKLAAAQAGILLNTQFTRQLDRHRFMDELIRYMQIRGTAILRTGWSYKTKEITKNIQTQVQVLNEETGQVSIQTLTEQKKEQIVIENKPTVNLCKLEDIVIDPTCQGDLDKANFIVYSFMSNYSELKSDPKYKNIENIKELTSDELLESNMNSNEDQASYEDTFSFKDKARKRLLVREYWGKYDINNDGIAEDIVCAWVGDTIIRLAINPYPEGKKPFISLHYNKNPFDLYGTGIVDSLEDSTRVKTGLLRGIIDNIVGSNAGQRGYKVGALQGNERSKYMNGQSFEFTGTPADFYVTPYNPLPSYIFSFYNQVNSEIESLSGVKGFGNGIGGSSLGTSATETKGVLSSTAKRDVYIVRNIAEGLIKLFRMWHSYNTEFLSEEEVVRITNDEFVPIRRDDLEGRIDIMIDIATAETNEEKAKELAFMLQTIGPNAEDPGITKLLQAKLFRLRKMPDLAKQLEEYQPEPNPLEQKMQELQIAKVEAEIESIRAKSQENFVDAQLKAAKTGTEEAKAQHFIANSENIPCNGGNNKEVDTEALEELKHQRLLELERFRHENELERIDVNKVYEFEKDKREEEKEQRRSQFTDGSELEKGELDHMRKLEQIKEQNKAKKVSNGS